MDFAEAFNMNKRVNAILLGEAAHRAIPVLSNATRQVVRNTGVQSALPPAGEDIDEVVAHRPIPTKVWIPAFAGMTLFVL